MTFDLQTLAALGIVAIAAGLLVRSVMVKRKTPGCGGGCGCPSVKIKERLRQQ
jgi:hypothetical protein